MKKDIVVTLLKQHCEPWLQADWVAGYLCNFAQREGGRACARWSCPTLKVRIQGVSRARVRVVLKALTDCCLRSAMTIVFIETQEAAAPIGDSIGAQVPWGTFVRQRLTKRLLYALPEGAYVIECKTRLLAERLGVAEERESVWRRAVASRAAYHVCSVAWSLDQFEEQQ